MDDEARKRLEQELRFLKESFEAEVISKEEFEKGKERIEKKLQGNGGNGIEPAESKEPEKKEAEAPTESASQVKSEEITEPKKDFESQQPPTETKELEKEAEKDNKAFKYAVVFVVLALIIFFGYSLLKQDKSAGKEEIKAQFIPACSYDKGCIKNGVQGICLNAGTKSAKCQFEIKKTKVTVINDRNNCFNCDTERVLGIIENWFGSLNVSELDYGTAQGKELADKFGINVLPAYIFESDITIKTAYNQIRQTFINKNGNYILSKNAAASTFYFRRENIQNKLDFFAKEGDASSTKAEKNLKEFLNAFPDIEFEKHSSNSNLAKELGVRTFPVFLVNNQIKFSGIHPAETIKDNFCSMNKLKECEKELSSNLV